MKTATNAQYGHLIVQGLSVVKELTHHEGEVDSYGGYPFTMNASLVKGAQLAVAPCLMKFVPQVIAAVKADKLGKAVLHIHPYDEMYLVMGNKGDVTAEIGLGEAKLRVSSPGAVYIPRELPHSIRVVDAKEGTYSGVIVMVMSAEYSTLPVPENPRQENQPETLVVRETQWREDGAASAAFGENVGYPLNMDADLVPCAKLSTLPWTPDASDIPVLKEAAHTHAADEVYLLLGEDGAVAVNVQLGNESYEACSPGAIYVPSGLAHSVSVKESEKDAFCGVCLVLLDGHYAAISAK